VSDGDTAPANFAFESSSGYSTTSEEEDGTKETNENVRTDTGTVRSVTCGTGPKSAKITLRSPEKPQHKSPHKTLESNRSNATPNMNLISIKNFRNHTISPIRITGAGDRRTMSGKNFGAGNYHTHQGTEWTLKESVLKDVKD
jgi:hypothetical protein